MTGRTALVIVVSVAEPLVGDVRARYDPVAAHGMLPHVTVLYPFVPPPASDEDIATLRELAASTPAFDFTLAGVRRFPGVLWLDPAPARPFIALTQRVTAAWPQHAPYEGAHDEIVPHLTVAHGGGALLDSVEPRLASGLPLHATARTLTLMERDASGWWSARAEFPLGAV
ncbi:MAG TPA: 2'-5' RNA ligase family protein [Candidatus Elarobacter sp.]|nr:2'-5' RNA ligase family protein [Candidatus Elarobacter sp.]